jgi:hypothetical protein
MRKALVLIGLLVAALLGWFALKRGQAGAESLAPPAAEAAARADAPHPLDPLPDASAAAGREAAVPAVTTEPAKTTAADTEADGIALRGTIVAIDENGVEHASEDGKFGLVAWKGQGSGGVQTVAVHSGAWTARVARGVEIGCQDAELGGRSAVPDGEVLNHPLRFPVPADGAVALRVRWLRALRIFVRDRDSKLDLADVTLVRAEGWPRPDVAHPGDVTAQRVLAQSKPSPVTLAPMSERELALQAGSPGHAWTLMKLDTAESVDRYVTLDPGGDLELELVAERIDKSTVVRVRDAMTLVVAEIDVADRRRLAFEGLRTGRCSVSAEIGQWWKTPIVLGTSEVEIRAGERAHALLTLASPPADVSVALGGELVVPVEWGTKELQLRVDLLDPPLGGREKFHWIHSRQMRADPERAGVWHWRIEGMQPGRYQLGVMPFCYSITLGVPATGLENVLIEVPKPGDARVRVVDAASGADAQVEHVYWNCRPPEGAQGAGSGRAEWDADARRWKLRAPRGEVELRAGGGDYKDLRQLVELREGTNEIVLEVTHQYSVLFKLAQAGHAVHWPDVVQIRMRPKEGGEEQSAWSSGREDVRVPFEHPGVWIVTLPEISGYEPVAPFEVRVDPEHGTEQTVELVPKG